MLNEKQLHRLKEQLQPLFPLMEKAAISIKDEQISNYPVFVVFKGEQELGLGLPLMNENQISDQWNVNASTLEELATKKIVAMEKVKNFCDIYKTHENSLCFFVWEGNEAKFIFSPIPNNSNSF